MSRTQYIIIEFKNGRASMKGNADSRHRDLAVSKLRTDTIEPTGLMKIKRFIKRLYLTARHSINNAGAKQPAAAEIMTIGLIEG